MYDEQDAAQQTRDAENEAAGAAQQVTDEAGHAGDEAAEAARRVLHAGASAGEQIAGAAGEQITQASDEAAEAARRVLHAGASAGEQIAGAAGEQIAEAGDEAAETARRVVRAGASAGKQIAGAGERTARAGAEVGKELAKAGEQVARTETRIGANMAKAFRGLMASGFDSMARLASQDGAHEIGWNVDLRAATKTLDGVLQSNAILVRGWQSAWVEVADFNRRSIERNAKGMSDLLRAGSMDEFISRQSDLLKGNIEDWLQSSISLFEMSADAARQAAEKVKEQPHS